MISKVSGFELRRSYQSSSHEEYFLLDSSTYPYSNLKCLFEKKMSLFSQSRKPLKVIRAVSIMLLIRFSMVAAVVRKLDRNG